MRIGVTGANGFIGSHLVDSLTADGHDVGGLVRKTSDLRFLDTRVADLTYGDLHDGDALRRFAAGVDAVVHCAARTTAADDAEMMRANVEGTENLIAACNDAGVSRLVFLSTLETVGDPGSEEPIRESVPLRPITSYGRSKAVAEERVRNSGISHAILRPGPVYGPRDTDVYLYFRLIDAGIRVIPPGTSRLSVCAWDSLIDAVKRALVREAPKQCTYFVADEAVFTWSSLTLEFAKAMDANPLPVRLPRWSLKAVALASAVHATLTGTVSIVNREKLRMFEVRNLAVSTRAASTELGFTPVPTDVALRRTVSWYRENGWLRSTPVRTASDRRTPRQST